MRISPRKTGWRRFDLANIFEHASEKQIEASAWSIGGLRFEHIYKLERIRTFAFVLWFGKELGFLVIFARPALYIRTSGLGPFFERIYECKQNFISQKFAPATPRAPLPREARIKIQF